MSRTRVISAWLGRHGRRPQQGSIIVPAAFAIIVGIVLLGSAQWGWHFYMKREMQNAADLAALSAVQVMGNLPSAATCAQARDAARDDAIAQMPALPAALTGADIVVDCVRWDPALLMADGEGIEPGAPVEQANAVRVEIGRRYSPIVPSLLPGERQTLITARAIATLKRETAAFSIASQLIGTQSDAPLMTLLNVVGLPVEVSVLDQHGLANAALTPAGLLGALVPDLDLATVTPAQLAGLTATGSQILTAAATVLERGGTQAAEVNLGVLKSLSDALSTDVRLGHLTIPLFGAEGNGGLFGVVTTAGRDAALHASVSALGLVSATIESATAAYGLAIKTIDAGLVRIQAGIVEPPSLGVGGVGTTAYNAQVRVFVELDSDRLKLLAPVLNLLNARIYLPLTLDLVRARGEITDIDCYATPDRQVTIQVHASAVQACFKDPGPALRFSRTQACGEEIRTGAQPTSSILTLLGVDLLPHSLRPLEVLGHDRDVRFNVPPGARFPMVDADQGNPGLLGDMLTQWLATISDGLAHPSLKQPSRQKDDYQAVATRYLEASKTGAKYDVDKAITLLKSGNSALGLAALGDWTVPGGVPRACGLGLLTCWDNGSVWSGLKSAATGAGQGLLGSVLGSLLGNLVVNSCNGLLMPVAQFNTCLRDNLASYLRTNPNDGDHRSAYYCGPVCTLLTPVLSALQGPLNDLGGLVVQTVLRDTLGVRLGQTETRLHDLQCNQARLVY